MSPDRFVLRAAVPQDLDDYERMARASAVGITTLPANQRDIGFVP